MNLRQCGRNSVLIKPIFQCVLKCDKIFRNYGNTTQLKVSMKLTTSYLDKLEEQIRMNSAPKIESFLKSKNYEIPRKLMARYVNLLRRMGGNKYALSLLNPIVRGEIEKPSVEEKIEYASCLSRLDLVDESIALLKSMLSEPIPEIHLEIAIAYMTKWDYPNAIPHLLRYLKFKNLTLYKICVGEINLAAAYLFINESDKAESILKKLLVRVKENNFNLLWGNALELLGEISLNRKDYDSASRYFRDCGDKLQSSDPRYQLYLERWEVIIKMLRENGSKESLDLWNRIRNQSAAIFDWNSLRELELYKATVTKDVETIKNLYYGVPYPEYRKRILSTWGKPIDLVERYDRKIGPGVAQPNKIFDVGLGKDLFTSSQLKPGQAIHRLMQVLTSDFYAPFLTEKIFSQVFKEHFFNPNTSPLQVRQLINRLNKWFSKNKIPFTVKRSVAGYRLRAHEAYILRIPINSSIRTKIDEFLDQLKEQGLVKSFSVKMVMEKLDLSRRSAIRLLNEAVASGKIIRQGRAKSTVYMFVQSSLN